jgi:hypothetical protein
VHTRLDPFELALLNAEPDDEPLSAVERAALRDGDLRRQRGELPVTHQELLRDLGISDPDLH